MPSIIFFGSSPFSTIVLEKIIDRVSAVVTTPDKPVGRHLEITPNPVKLLAQKHKIPIFDDIKMYLEWAKTQDLSDALGLSVAYKKLIGPKTRASLNNRVYNIHPSLLPKYRGPSPIQFQILNDETQTGYTIYLVDDLEDHGPIIYQEKETILTEDTTTTLAQKLFSKATDKLIKSDFKILDITPIIQDESLSTDTRLLTRQDGFIPWEEFTKFDYNRKFRAFHPWPGIWTTNPSGRRLKLVSLNPVLIQYAGQKPKTWK